MSLPTIPSVLLLFQCCSMCSHILQHILKAVSNTNHDQQMKKLLINPWRSRLTHICVPFGLFSYSVLLFVIHRNIKRWFGNWSEGLCSPSTCLHGRTNENVRCGRCFSYIGINRKNIMEKTRITSCYGMSDVTGGGPDPLHLLRPDGLYGKVFHLFTASGFYSKWRNDWLNFPLSALSPFCPPASSEWVQLKCQA